MSRFSFISALFLFSLLPIVASGQEEKKSAAQWMKENTFLSHLNLSVNAGSTGIGVELSAPMTEFATLRAGFDYMPRFQAKINFGVQVGEKQPGQTDAEFEQQSQNRFTKLAGFLEGFTGYKVNNSVDMIGRPTFYNFKLLVDVHPFAKSSHKGLRNLYVTAGFYVGNAQIAEAYNTTEDMPTLFSVNMYNRLYDRLYDKFVANPDYYDSHGFDISDYFPLDKFYGSELPKVSLSPEKIKEIAERVKSLGRMGMYIGDYSHDIPQRDSNGEIMYRMDEQGNPVLDANGEKVPVLAHKKGDHYTMVPDADCMVRASITANRFKPYVGLGYGTNMNRSKSGWGVSVDAGVLFWGGSPSLITHDGTDLINDLVNVRGKVGTYTDIVNKFKVYPVLNVKVTKRLF